MIASLLMLIGWIVFSIAVGKRAQYYNRRFWPWFWLSIVFSPLAGMLLVFLLPPLEKGYVHRKWVRADALEAPTVEGRKLNGAIALVCMLPIAVIVLGALFAPFLALVLH